MRNRTFQVVVPTEFAANGLVITQVDVVLVEGTKISTEAGVLLVWDENPDGSGAPPGGRVHHVVKMYAPGQWVSVTEDQVR